MRDRVYGWIIEMQLKAIRQRKILREYPVTTYPSEAPSKISGTLRGSIGAATKILGAIFVYGAVDGIYKVLLESWEAVRKNGR